MSLPSCIVASVADVVVLLETAAQAYAPRMELAVAPFLSSPP